MKQILTNLKVLLTLMLLCGVSSVWAENSTDTWVFVKQAFMATLNGSSTEYQWTASNGSEAVASASSYNAEKGIQTTHTKLVLTCPNKYKNVSSVVVSYSTNDKSTAKISVKAGTATSEQQQVEKGKTNVDLTFDFSAEEDNQNIVITCDKNGTAGSLYIKTVKVVYGEFSATPSISASNIDIEADATSGEIAYTIVNPVEGKSLTASTDAEWISNVTVTSEKVTFNAEKNTGDARTATIVLKYEGAADKNITVTQAKAIPTYASLVELVEAGTPTTAGETVKVTLSNEVITEIYVTKSGYRNGIYLKAGDKEIEVFCYDVPESWEVGGTVSGTLTCPWKIYNETWELCPSSWNGLTYTAPSTEKYQINIDNLTNGTITASAEEAVEGAEISLTITPNAHYALKDGSLVVLNETTSDEITVTNNKFKMPASDVLVSAEFVEVPKYTVLYSVLGEDAGSEDVYANEFIAAAPTVKDMAGWKFAGWTTNDMYESSTAAPTFFTASTPVVEDVILYAVFKKVENSTGEVWNLVEDASTLQSNDVIRLAATVSGASKAENNGTFAASAFGEGGKFFTSTSASIEDNQLTATGAIDITLDKTINGWTLTTSEGVVGTKAAKAMLLDNTDAGTINEWTISIENGAATITAGDKGRILYNRDSPRFLNYTSNTSASLVLPSIFRKEVSGTTTYALNIPMYYDLTMSSTGYATLYLDYPSAIPYGFKAYRAEAVDASGKMIKLEEIQDNVPANFGVLVKGEANATAIFKGFYIPGGMPTGIHNLFRGVVEDTDVDDVAENTIYVLNAAESTDANPKFSQYTGSTLNANKAYLDLEVPAGANLTFVFGDATGIDTVETVKAATTRVNLAGQVVGKDYKGVVIENGKKFLNK